MLFAPFLNCFTEEVGSVAGARVVVVWLELLFEVQRGFGGAVEGGGPGDVSS